MGVYLVNYGLIHILLVRSLVIACSVGRKNPDLCLFQILGWAGFVRVDNVSYSFLGDSPLVNGTITNLTNIVITPTRTVVTSRAGPMQVNVTFLNPIEVCLYSLYLPDTFYIRHSKRGDLVKQSIPFSYITFAAKSLDGSAHAVQVYTDVSGGT